MATNEAKEPKEKPDSIDLKVMGQDGKFLKFKIAKHTALKKLMSTYCERTGLDIQTIRFSFDGSRINESDTPKSLDLQEGDTLEVFMQQTGGVSDESNPIGMLLEYAQGTGCDPPQYEDAVLTPGRKIIFTVQVSYLDLRTWGEGGSKKSAKHDAARNMYAMLQRDAKNRSVDKETSMEVDTESEEDKNLSGGVVNKGISVGDVLVDRGKDPIMSSSPGIGLLSFFQNV